MADLSGAARAYNALLIARSNDLADQISQVWASVTLADIDAGWQQAKAAAVSTVVRGQLVGAAAALLYHRTLLAAHDVTPSGPQIRPLGFAGQGSGKLGLSEVVDFAPIRVKQAIARGLPARQALTVGQAQLEAVADSELHEAARGVMDVAMNTEQAYRGYLRHPNPGACGRCLILANRFYRTNEGFERHPRCSCSHVPILVGQEKLNLPDAGQRFRRMSTAEQDRAFGKDAAEAIRAGSDPAAVTNARAGMRAAGEPFTTQGTSARSVSGQRLRAAGQTRRLSPAGCRIKANGDPVKYRELLFQHGYIA